MSTGVPPKWPPWKGGQKGFTVKDPVRASLPSKLPKTISVSFINRVSISPIYCVMSGVFQKVGVVEKNYLGDRLWIGIVFVTNWCLVLSNYWSCPEKCFCRLSTVWIGIGRAIAFGDYLLTGIVGTIDFGIGLLIGVILLSYDIQVELKLIWSGGYNTTLLLPPK